MATGRKTGGRTKGTPNKDKAELLELIRQHIDDPNFHPVLAMAEIAVDDKRSIDIRTTMLKELAQYVAPKLKAVEHSVGEIGGINLTFDLSAGRDNGAGEPQD